MKVIYKFDYFKINNINLKNIVFEITTVGNFIIFLFIFLKNFNLNLIKLWVIS